MTRPVLTLERVREKIRANFPKAGAPMPYKLTWANESLTSIITTCNRYRIHRRTNDDGTREYFIYTVASETCAPNQVAGPFNDPQSARDAAQTHLDHQTRSLPL